MTLPPTELDAQAIPSERQVQPTDSDVHAALPRPTLALAHSDPQAGRILYRLATDAGGWAPTTPDNHDGALEAARTVYRYARLGQSGAVPSAQAFATVLEAAAGAIGVTTWTDTLVNLVRVPAAAVEQPAPAIVDDVFVMPSVTDLSTVAGTGGHFLAIRPVDDGRTLGAQPDGAVEWWTHDDVVDHLRATTPEIVAVNRLFDEIELAAFVHDDPEAVRRGLMEPEAVDTDPLIAESDTAKADGGGAWW